jgi:hypothetical protein
LTPLSVTRGDADQLGDDNDRQGHSEIPDEVHVAALQSRRQERPDAALDRVRPLLDRGSVEGLLHKGTETAMVGLVPLEHEDSQDVPQGVDARALESVPRE